MRLLRFFVRMAVVFGAGLGVVVLTADHIPGGQIGGGLYGVILATVCIFIVTAWSWGDWPTDPGKKP